ncbi:MAG: 30S ribosomal protein S8 [Spirochaetes bacterium]|nr:30S ribosomal protein S8 [Spirochaetota bacterium]
MSAVSDPIADMLTRIRNAINSNKKTVDIPFSTIKESIAKILKDEGFINGYKVVEDNMQNFLKVDLKYSDMNESALQSLKRLSTPGRRVYIKAEDIKPVYNNMGVWILSTSKGVITNKAAKKLNIGGEVLCEIL